MLTSKHNSLFEWNKADPKAVANAKQHGFIDEICEMFGWQYEKRIHKPRSYWTLELCKEDALKYKNKTEWAKNSENAYRAALKNGWLDECCTHMRKQKPRSYWTKKLCKEEAKKYKNRTDWIKHSASSYNAAKANGWLDECCTHMVEPRKPRSYWTLERCKEEALKFNSRADWSRYSGNSSYQIARLNGWLDECCAHMYTKLPRKMIKIN